MDEIFGTTQAIQQAGLPIFIALPALTVALWLLCATVWEED